MGDLLTTTLAGFELTTSAREEENRGRFSFIFSGENSAENFAENFPPENVGKKIEFSAEKVLKNRFFQEIPRNFPRKIIFRGKLFSAEKNVRKIGPTRPRRQGRHRRRFRTL
jgi:hypothetical protein